MDWFSRIFGSIGMDVASSANKMLGDIVSSDDRLGLSDSQKEKIITAYESKMKGLLAQVDQWAAEHEESLENELTSQLKLDMKSDSWLSKNVRPITLIFMTLVISILAFTTTFNNNLTEIQLSTIKSWIPFFQSIMLAIYGFYFGSRGLEKIQKIRGPSTAKTRAKSKKLFT